MISQAERFNGFQDAITTSNEGEALEKLQALLKEGMEVNNPFSNGETPLLWAVCFDRPELVKLLLDNGALVNQESLIFDAVLYKIVYFNRPELTKLLRDHAIAAQNLASMHDKSLYEDFCNKHPELEKLLLNHVSETNRLSESGHTPLREAVCNNNPELIKLLLLRGADINQAPSHGETALWEAVACNNIALAELLLNHGANVGQVTPSDHTLLYDAVCNNNPNLVKLLLWHRAEVNKVGPGGYTALYQALLSGHVNLINPLLACEVNVNQITPLENTLLWDVIFNKTPQAAELLIQYGVDVDYREDCLDGQWTILEQLLRIDSDAYKREVSLLIRAGATFPSSNIMQEGKTQFFASAEAIKNDYYEAVGTSIGKMQDAEIAATLKAWPYLSSCFIFWHKAMRHIEDQPLLNGKSLTAKEVAERAQQQFFALLELPEVSHEKSATDFFGWLERIQSQSVPEKGRWQGLESKIAALPQEIRDHIMSELYQLLLPETLKQPIYLKIARGLKPHTSSFYSIYKEVNRINSSFRNR